MYNEEFETYLKLFQMELTESGHNHAPDWALFRSTEATALLKARAATFGGLPSVSGFIRAFSELRSEGAIRQLRAPKPAGVESHDLTAAEYNKMSAREITTKYRASEEFREQVDKLIAAGAI